jgi:hypothetical protein
VFSARADRQPADAVLRRGAGAAAISAISFLMMALAVRSLPKWQDTWQKWQDRQQDKWQDASQATRYAVVFRPVANSDLIRVPGFGCDPPTRRHLAGAGGWSEAGPAAISAINF